MEDGENINENLVKRGEILIDIGFLKETDEELKKLNKGKRGRPYRYSEGLFMFLAYLYAFMRNYRILEGLCRAFSRIVKEFPVPDHSTIHRRL